MIKMVKAMLSEYGCKDSSSLNSIFRVFLFLIAAAVFIGGSALLVYLYQVPSIKQKQVIKEQNIRRQELCLKLEFTVLDAGYLERQTPGRLIYVPVIFLEIYNRSEEMFPAIEISPSFSMKTTHICTGVLTVQNFLPGARHKLRLSCSESVMFGTVITGIGRDQTRNSMEYSIHIGVGGVFIPELQGTIEYKLF